MVEIKLPSKCRTKPISFSFPVLQKRNTQRLYKLQNERIDSTHKACLQDREGEEEIGGF